MTKKEMYIKMREFFADYSPMVEGVNLLLEKLDRNTKCKQEEKHKQEKVQSYNTIKVNSTDRNI